MLGCFWWWFVWHHMQQRTSVWRWRSLLCVREQCTSSLPYVWRERDRVMIRRGSLWSLTWRTWTGSAASLLQYITTYMFRRHAVSAHILGNKKVIPPFLQHSTSPGVLCIILPTLVNSPNFGSQIISECSILLNRSLYCTHHIMTAETNWTWYVYSTNGWVLSWSNGKWPSLFVPDLSLTVEKRYVQPLNLKTKEVVVLYPHTSLVWREWGLVWPTGREFPLTSIKIETPEALWRGLHSVLEFMARREMEAARGNMKANKTPPHTNSTTRTIDTYTHLHHTHKRVSLGGSCDNHVTHHLLRGFNLLSEYGIRATSCSFWPAQIQTHLSSQFNQKPKGQHVTDTCSYAYIY